jgi:spoIIIJ-associated protein
MIQRDELEEIEKIIKEFFEKTTFSVEVEVLPQKDLTIPVNLKTDEPQVLIGEGGQTLFEIQHLLKAILIRKVSFKGDFGQGREENFYIDLDINGYKKKKNNYLKELARSVADEVFLTKKEKALPPMSAQERRIIHLELAGRSDVVTESIGEEPERKLVIKPHI